MHGEKYKGSVRTLAVVVLVSGCSLYFDAPRRADDRDDDDDDDQGEIEPYTCPEAAAAASPCGAYIKASNTGARDMFGERVAMSADGSTLAVAAPYESSDALGVGGMQTNDNGTDSGAVYVFVRAGASWEQQAYLKPGISSSGNFGLGLAISGDGSTIVVGQPFAPTRGLAYVFERTGTTWQLSQQIEPDAPQDNAFFGSAVAISADASTIAVGAYDETLGVSAPSQTFAGAVHVFERAPSGWSETASFAPTNTQALDYFGSDVALSHNGSRLVVGAPRTITSIGSAYVFARHGSTWKQEQELIASNADNGDYFGVAVAISPDGATVAVGAPREDGENNALPESGAVHVFARSDTTWTEDAILEPKSADGGGGTGGGSGSGDPNAGPGDELGWSVALDRCGTRVVAGAWREASAAIGIGGDESDNSMADAGAVYSFVRHSSGWRQQSYIKASNTNAGDRFGIDVSVSEAGTLAVGASRESSAAQGIDGDEQNNEAPMAGAVYTVALP